MGCHIIEISNAKFVSNIADKTILLLLFCELDLQSCLFYFKVK